MSEHVTCRGGSVRENMLQNAGRVVKGAAAVQSPSVRDQQLICRASGSPEDLR